MYSVIFGRLASSISKTAIFLPDLAFLAVRKVEVIPVIMLAPLGLVTISPKASLRRPGQWPLLPFSPKTCLIRKAQEDRPSVFRSTVSKAFLLPHHLMQRVKVIFRHAAFFCAKIPFCANLRSSPPFTMALAGLFRYDEPVYPAPLRGC